MLCENNKSLREESLIKFQVKLHKTDSDKHSDEFRRNIAQEMIKDTKKYFQFHNEFCTNQEILGFRELFRGISLKGWFIQCNDVLLFEQ